MLLAVQIECDQIYCILRCKTNEQTVEKVRIYCVSNVRKFGNMKDEHSCNENKVDGRVFETLENTLLSVATHCTDDFFDWLSLDELAALNSTCTRLQQLTEKYFQRKYPMKTMKVGEISGTNDINYRCSDRSMDRFKQNVRNLVVLPSVECLQYLKSNHNCKDLVSVAFYDGEIESNVADAMADLIANAEIIEVQYGSIHGEFYESVLKFGKSFKQLVIKYGFNECENDGIENQWLLKTYPTLEHFHWSSSPLPDNLDTFFRLNPQIRSFNSSIYTTMNTMWFLNRTGICIDELHLELILELYEEEREGMEIVRTHLNALYKKKQIKRLMVQFIFCSQFLDPEWGRMDYLTGVYIDFPHRAGATRALCTLVHLKLLVLGINTILSRAKSSILTKHLINLEEIYVQINSIYAIVPFLRKAKKLKKIYVYGMGLAKSFSGKCKANQMATLNDERIKLLDACKTTVFLPDHAYVQIKWKFNDLNFSLIEIKRSEAHIVRHPFAATILRREICELYERF